MKNTGKHKKVSIKEDDYTDEENLLEKVDWAFPVAEDPAGPRSDEDAVSGSEGDNSAFPVAEDPAGRRSDEDAVSGSVEDNSAFPVAEDPAGC